MTYTYQLFHIIEGIFVGVDTATLQKKKHNTISLISNKQRCYYVLHHHLLKHDNRYITNLLLFQEQVNKCLDNQ